LEEHINILSILLGFKSKERRKVNRQAELEADPGDRGGMFPQNAWLIPNYTALQSRRPYSVQFLP
jgi:hypothetical protein